ncbi:MAG TPA: hypothetical protein VL944_01635 [Candidatus Acidoferrum sp.]|nr:hypothetical protein [Candidatus Acidoferrum sp.]
MPKGEAGQKREERPKRQAEPKKGERRKYIAVVAIVIIVVIVAGAVVYGLNATQPTSISTFKNNFNSASRVSIYITAYNGTALSYSIGCATSIIESIVGNGQNHRNASTIDLFIANQTTCVYQSGIGSVVTNYTFGSIENCTNTARSEPSIFINYSSTNRTTITPRTLYVSGDGQFLSLCGVASEIT